jgi:hypothetical protein
MDPHPPHRGCGGVSVQRRSPAISPRVPPPCPALWSIVTLHEVGARSEVSDHRPTLAGSVPNGVEPILARSHRTSVETDRRPTGPPRRASLDPVKGMY